MDYINLYTHLYPNRIIENNIPKTIESCMENLNTMGDDELEDFINLIKTTIFWTDENSSKLYKELQERIKRKENLIYSNINSENLENLKQECGELRSFLLDNYSMGYFNTAINNEELFNELNASEEYNYYIARYLTLFNGEIITPDKYKEIFKGGLKNIIYYNFRCCFNMMNGLRERRISPDVCPDEFLG